MREYQYIMDLYEKQQKNSRHLFIFTIIMLILPTLILLPGFYPINPGLLYLGSLSIVLIYRQKIQQQSKYYPQLEEVIKGNFPELLENKPLLFFIDYQLKNYFGKESQIYFQRLKEGRKDKEAKKNLLKMIIEVKNYYNYLALDEDLQNDTDLSLALYRQNAEKRKQNLV